MMSGIKFGFYALGAEHRRFTTTTYEKQQLYARTKTFYFLSFLGRFNVRKLQLYALVPKYDISYHFHAEGEKYSIKITEQFS